MRIVTPFLVMALGICWAGNPHSVILRFDGPVDINARLSGYNVVSAQELPGQFIYRVEIDTQLSYQELSSQLHQISSLLSHEPNQKSVIDGPESAASIDQRPILILDQRPILILDQRPILILDESGRLAADDPAMAALFKQPFMSIIRAEQAWQDSVGAGVKVAVLDTGIDTAHPLFSGAIAHDGYDFVDEDPDAFDERSGLDSNENGSLDDGWGHGTHTAGIIRLVAPGATILPIRVVDSDGLGDLFDILQGLEHALNSGAQVINLSLSIPEPSPLLQEWINKAKTRNVVVVTSAGNQNSSEVDFPANEPTVVSVASINNYGEKSAFSNHGSDVDVAAPGERVLSAVPGGNSYVERTGTSMVAPMVSAQAALILELNPTINFHSLTNRIKNTAYDLDIYNPDYFGMLGRGLIDLPASL